MLQSVVSLHSNSHVPEAHNISPNAYPSRYLEFCVSLSRWPMLRELCSGKAWLCIALCMCVDRLVSPNYVSCRPDSSCDCDGWPTHPIRLIGFICAVMKPKHSWA